VNFESRSVEHSERQDIVNIKKTFHYIQGTKKMRILYSKEEKQDSCLTGYVDSDFAGCTTSKWSTTGFVIMFNGSPIAWKSRKQDIERLSTTEAEYVAAAECAKEAKYLKSFYEELTKEIRLVLMVDNQSAIHLVKSGQMNRKTKHIDVRYHFLSEIYYEGVFDIVYCPTEEQVADIFTKPLTRIKFERCRDKMTNN